MGELESWMDENFLRFTWYQVLGQVPLIKLIRDKYSGYVCVCVCVCVLTLSLSLSLFSLSNKLSYLLYKT